MLYKQRDSKNWWVMFRDPNRKGKFVRLSTGTDDHDAALEIEKSVALGIRGKVEQSAMERILRTIYASAEGLSGIRLDEAWGRYARVQSARGKIHAEKFAATLRSEFMAFASWAKERRGLRIVRQVTSEIAMDYAAHIRRMGRLMKDGTRVPLKDKSRRNKITALSSIWRVLAGIEPEIGDPWRNCVPIVRDSERGLPFTREQEAAILDAAGSGRLPEWRTICLVARHTGLRKGDVFRLRWGMVDLRRGVIGLEPNKTRNYQIAVAIPIVGALRVALEAHRRLCPAALRSGEHFLFPRFASSYPNDPEQESFGDILRRAKVQGRGLSFHSYRHTFRTRLKEAGVPDEIAKELGGWTQDATLARYNHADETERLRKMMEKIA